MEHYRLRKYRGPETWARVRVAYEQGQSGPEVARRFDVGLANLRKKGRMEGWTRTATAARLDPDTAREAAPAALPGPAADPEPAPDPAKAAAMAVARASSALAAGRAVEAQALLKGADALMRAVSEGGAAAPPPPRELTPEEDAEKEREARLLQEAFWASVEQRAGQLAMHMLTDMGGCDMNFCSFAYRWRAEVLGPDCTAADILRIRSVSSYLDTAFWDDAGAPLPARATNESRWLRWRRRIRMSIGLPAYAPGEKLPG